MLNVIKDLLMLRTDLTLSDIKKLAFSYRETSKNVESTYA